jgi:pyruvate dehydrogenase E1 component beta subunit
MTGMRPIVDVMFGDFITLTMDQMVNQAAKAHYMSGGKIKVPIVFRTTLGRHAPLGRAALAVAPRLGEPRARAQGGAARPGPTRPRGLMKTAIRDDSPVVIFEDKMMYRVKGPVPEGDYTIRSGVAEIKREGKDITLVATSSMVIVALAAGQDAGGVGISAEVIDPRTTWPLDKQTLIDSAKKTSRAIVIDEGYERYGVTAEIASVIADGAFYHLDAPVKRIGAMDVPVPFSPVLEDLTVPTRRASSRRPRRSAARRLMPTNVIMPALGAGPGDRQGPALAQAAGDTVSKGEPLVEIETDKVTVEIESPGVRHALRRGGEGGRGRTRRADHRAHRGHR